MKSHGESTYLQCQCCGHIVQVNKRISIEEIYTKEYCKNCDEVQTMLNLGDDLSDRYLYGNPNYDERYY